MKQSPRGRRFHLFYALHNLRYGFLLCLVPMVQALIAFDLDSLFLALRQDAVILILCAVLALLFWRCTGFQMEKKTIRVWRGVLLRQEHLFRADSIAALEIRRPLLYRIFGAAQVTLYFRTVAAPRSFTLYLTRRDAERAADLLLPVQHKNCVFAPTGYERMAFIMLSANALTTWYFIVVSARRAAGLLGENLGAFAQQNFSRLELVFEQFLPAGAAMLTALFFLLFSVTFLRSLLRTARVSVCRNGGVLISHGGLITKMERRLWVQSISACDVRVTPVARLLRRYPVYLSAGSFRGGDVPVMVVRADAPLAPQALVPGYAVPSAELCMPRRKSWGQYLWKPGLVLGFSVVLCLVASVELPQMVPVLLVPAFLGFFAFLVSLEGWWKEGVCRNANRTLGLCFTRFFTRHEVCVLAPDVAYTTMQHPMALSAGWADLKVHLPCGLSYRVRGVVQYLAHRLAFTL